MNRINSEGPSIIIKFCAALALGLLGALVTAQAGCPGADPARPSIGLVLSGGGARGAAHVGVLKVLEELRVPVDCIAGTSMGAIVGGLYASGMPVPEIERTLAEIDWGAVFDDQLERDNRPFRRKRDDDLWLIKGRLGVRDGELRIPTGLIQGQKIRGILSFYTLPVSGVRDFDLLPIPFRAVATDIVTGEEVVLGGGVLAEAVHASMAIPAVFAPVEIGDHLLVDGGVSNNLPISVARAMGADLIIAVDISTPLYQREELDSLLAITDQLSNFLTRRNTERQIKMLDEQDVLLLPDMSDLSSASFDRIVEAVQPGAAAAIASSDILRRLSLADGDWIAYRAARRPAESREPVITSVRIENRSPLADDLLRARAEVETGEPLDVRDLQRSVDRIYGLELFDEVSYRLEDNEQDRGSDLTLAVKERSWGPGYLQLGTRMSGSFDGDDAFELGASYLRTAVNSWNGEWRVGGSVGDEPSLFFDFYQPLGVRSAGFVEPVLLYGRRNINIYDEQGGQIGETRVKEGGFVLSGGVEIGDWGEIRAGWRRIFGENDTRFGDPGIPAGNFDDGALFVRASIDEVDDLYFPSRGADGFLEYRRSRPDYGADELFDIGKLMLT
ncbi:MAG: patatin-like phospholipase family protein, partial [Gammaproteobacteria bacterium]